MIIPTGMSAKIWAKRLSGAACVINYQYNQVATAGSWTTISSDDLASAGEIDLEKRRPIALRGITGNEGFRIQWSQSVAAVSRVEFEVVFSDEGAEEE